MVDKLVLKQIIQNSREEIEQFQIVHRDVRTDDFNCCIFVGVRRAGKSFVLYEKIQQMLREGHSWNDILYTKAHARGDSTDHGNERVVDRHLADRVAAEKLVV